jgi:hypothetical protein
MLARLLHGMQQWKEKWGAELVREEDAEAMEQGRGRGTVGDQWISG